MSIWWKKCNSDRWLIKDKHRYDCRNRHACEKDHIWNHNTCSCENGKYLERVMDDSVNTCHEIMESYDEERKTIPTNFNRKKANFKMKNVCILLVFLDYHCIIDSCYYLLLSDKISSETKVFISISLQN